MANNANMGFEHRFAFGANPHTFSGTSTRFEVVSSSVGKQGEILDAQGVLGTRTRREDRTRAGIVNIGGQLVLEPSMRMWDFFLPYILGAAESTDTFDVADTLPGFDMLHDPFGTGANAVKLNELYVSRASLRFGPGILQLTLDVVGKTITTGQTYTSAALGSSTDVDWPLVFYDSASGFSIQSGAIEIIDGELTVENPMEVLFRNSQTALAIRPSDRIVSLATNIPLTSSTWTTYFGDKAAVDATITITRGTVASVITLFNLKNPDRSPELGGKGEVPLVLQSAARGDASDPDIRVTVIGGSL